MSSSAISARTRSSFASSRGQLTGARAVIGRLRKRMRPGTSLRSGSTRLGALRRVGADLRLELGRALLGQRLGVARSASGGWSGTPRSQPLRPLLQRARRGPVGRVHDDVPVVDAFLPASCSSARSRRSSSACTSASVLGSGSEASFQACSTSCQRVTAKDAERPSAATSSRNTASAARAPSASSPCTRTASSRRA